MVFSPAQPPSKATGKPQARQACMATPIAKRKTREPTTATPAGGGSIAQLSSKIPAERKDRKKLKAALAARGIKCEGCSSREHYLDRLLDSVHLPLKS